MTCWMWSRKYGTPDEINAKAAEARQAAQSAAPPGRAQNSPYLADVQWLIAQRDADAFVSVAEYRRVVLGPRPRR